jgi:uncharacterized protein YecE (DUF72 family)
LKPISSSQSPCQLRIGPAGWSYADWEGVVYPRPKPRNFHAIPYLGQFFDTIEINSSFYAHPKPEHATRWRELVEELPNFRFTAKLNRVFTHDEFGSAGSFEQHRGAFSRGIQPIADRLGAVLVQFPISFRDAPDSRFRIDRIREAFGEYGLVLELRHSSWFTADALLYIETTNCSLAAIDLPHAANHPPEDSPTPGPIGYLRLHGRNGAAWFDSKAGRDQRYDYLYPPDELTGLVRRAKTIAGGSETTFVVTNNHYTGKAVANALEISYLILGQKAAAPTSMLDNYPHLRPITIGKGQQSLF